MNILDAETKALLRAGFIRPIDVVCGLALVVLGIVAVTMIASGAATTKALTIMALIGALLLSYLIIALLYRILNFVIRLTARFEVYADDADAVFRRIKSTVPPSDPAERS